MRPSIRNQRGMTLMEIMLAMTILATLITLTWSTISASFALRKASLDKFDRYRSIQMTMERMSRELSMSFVTNIGQESTNVTGEITYRTIFEGDAEELHFTALSHVRTRIDEPSSEQTEVSYRLERRQGEDGRYHTHLVRRSQFPIDDTPDEGGFVDVLLEDVEDITFEYWDGTREIAGDAWVRQWDAFNDHDGRLPDRVQITLKVPHPINEDRTLEFTTQTQLYLNKPLVVIPQDVARERDALIQEIEAQLAAEGFEEFQGLDDFGEDML